MNQLDLICVVEEELALCSEGDTDIVLSRLFIDIVSALQRDTRLKQLSYLDYEMILADAMSRAYAELRPYQKLSTEYTAGRVVDAILDTVDEEMSGSEESTAAGREAQP
jgi:hypothetical protein